MSKLLEVLKDESCWCRDALAKNKAGFEVNPSGNEAIQFSLAGALLRVYGADVLNFGEYKPLPDVIREKFPDRAVSPIIFSFNDNPETTFDDVVAVIKEASL